MLSFADSVPFMLTPNVSDYANGIYQIAGLMTYQNQKLGLEYKLNSSYLTNAVASIATHVTKPSEIIRHEFELNGLRNVALKVNIFQSKIIIVANSLGLFEAVHGAVHEKLTLQVTRAERKNAKSFISILQADLSEMKLSRLSDD